MLQLIDDETASRYYNEIDTATGDDLQTKMSALESWATDKKAKQHRQEWDHVSKVFTDFDNYSAAEGLNDLDEESRYQYANRKFIANQTGDKFEDQMFVYPSKRDEVTDKMFGKTGVSEKEAFNLFKGAVESRKSSEEALRELPGVLAQGVLKSAGEGKQFDEVDSWFAFDGWKQRHADKLGAMPAGWETAMLDSAVKLHARTEALMADVAPESKRAMDTLMKFTRPEDAESLPDADRSDVENLAKDFAKLTPEQRDGIYATLSYAAEAGGAGMGKGFWEKVGEGIARGGVNIYDDAAITAQDRQARQNISFFQDLIDKPQAEPDRMQTADSIQMQRDMAQKGLEENKQRLGELRVMREIRDLAQGRIDPIKTEMDGVLGSVVQGAYDFSQSAAYTGMAMIPYVGLPAVMGALANSNYLRMLDQYPDMDADAAFDLSLAIAGPQAVIERFQGGLLLGKLPYLNQAMKRLTDVRVPLPARLGLGYAGVVGAETVTELAQEAMPVVADQIASAVREDMPEFDSEKAWGAYREQAPKIFYSMLWGGLIGGGAVGIRELDRSGVFMRNLQELEMHGITGEAAQNIAAEQDADQATTLYREAWDKRSPEDIQAGIAKRAAMLDAAQATQANPDLPTRRVEQAPDGTTTHIIEQNGQTIYSTNDPAAADLALVNFTRMVDRGRITGTTNGIVEALSFFNQVNEAANRGDDVQKFILENTPRNLLDEYEANPTEQNLDNLFKTVATIGQDISEPAELANFPVLASNQGALAEGIFKSVIRIYEGATGDKVVRDVAQDNLKRAIAEQRITMDWVRENLNQIIPQIDSERISQKLRTETDTDVIESFSDVALAYMRGNVREEQIPEGFRGFLRRMAIVVKDIFRRAYKLKRLVAEGKVDANFESLLADSVGLNQQARVDTASSRVSKDIITDGGQMLMDFSIGSRTSAVSTDTPSIRASNATVTGPANYSIAAHHGTPHKVDRFSANKIGTGEGAQAYGWGLYFAEAKKVAKSYQNQLSNKAIKDDPVERDAWRIVFEARQPWSKETPQQSIERINKQKWGDDKLDAHLNRAQEILQKNEQPGNLYTVDLDVEPEDLLDWDKPFSEQSPKVQAALQSISGNWLWKDAISGKGGEQVGAALYSTLRATFPDAEFSRDGVDASKKASEALLAAGIPGIRYLDGGSRSEGQGTYNYVAFDENLIKITEENGNRIAATDALAAPATGATNYSIGSMPVAKVVEVYERTPDPTLVKLGMDIDLFNGKREIRAKIQFANAFELEKVLEMTDGEDAVDLPEWVNAAIESAVPNFKSSGWGYLNSEDTTETTAMISVGEDVPVPDNIVPFFATTINDDPLKSPDINYSIRSVEHFKNDKRFDKLVKDGRVVIGHDIEEFKGMHILLHSPDNAFAGTIKLTDGEEIQGKGGVYYPALYANKNYFWASTEGKVMQSANHLNEIGQKNGGKILMALVSAPVEKLFSSTSMATGVVKFLNSLTSNPKAGLSKKDLNSMLVAASEVEYVKKGAKPKKFKTSLAKSDGLEKNLSKINTLLDPTKSIFQVRKMFSESLADQLSKHLKTNPEGSNYVAEILADAENKHAKRPIKRGTLSKASILQGLGNLFTEPFLRDFQDHGNGKIYAVLEVDGMVDGVASKEHDSYPFTLVPQNKKSKVKLHILNQAVDWQDVVGRETGEYTTPEERIFLMPTGGMSVKTLKVLGVRGGSKANPLNYSIASQSEIDRVNRALGGMNRGPDERLKVYERARQKFSKLMAWNSDELAAMADTGSDDSQIRRTQILQALGELDGILSVLPPEVRGRVGGYTKLAGIAPMDVLKDGVKVSEVSGMNGAIISAWMREGQNIGQAGKQVSLPPGYEAKENLATARADKAIADFFRDRIKKIDTEFEKVVAREYRNAILDLVKKSRPKSGDNGVRKSTLGAETQKLADMVQRATLMDEDATAERMLQLEQTMATSENSADMMEEWGILNQFGDLKNRNSETLAQAYGWFKDQLQMGREAWRIKEEARIAENRERAKKTVEFIGGATAVDRFKDKTFMDRVSDWANSALLDHANFEQFVMALLPPDVAADFSKRLRKADVAAQKAEIDQREGILNALREGAKAAGTTHGKAMVMLKTEVPSAVRYLDGRKVKNTKLTIEQAEKIVRGEIDRGDLTDTDVRDLSVELAALPADTRKENITIRQVVYPGKEVRLPMTRGKAIQLLLSWNQPDVQDKMRREGWNDDSITDLRELTSDPVSQAMISHAQELYGKGAGITKPVYSRMFGMNMPQVKNYAPTRFLNAKDTKDIGLDGSPVSTGTTPSFAKSRVSHSAKIAPEDALSVMQQHILMQAHWVNFAELAREYRSLLNNPEVREAIKTRHGSGVLKTAEQWADQMEQRGGNQAREAKWVTDIIGSVIGGQSVASLGFNLKTIAMQLDNAVRFGLALDKKQIASAMSSPDQLIKDIKTVFESDALQTRLRGGATAETRYMFERFGGRPGTAAKVTELSMKPMNWMDVSSFSFSAAIVYRANLNEALEAGMPESLARETALDAAAAAIYRFSQPVSFGQKSNVENSGNMFTKAFFLFMSDPRLKAAIMADAVRGLATGRGDKWTHIRRLVAVELMAVLSHVVASSYRDAFTDDEDDDIWSLGGWVRAIALAPVQGYLFIGTMLDSVLSQLTGAGFFTPTQNPLLTISQTGIRALKNADDILAFDDPDALLKEWIAIARTMAVAPGAAMPAVLLNLVKPIFGAADNATTDE